MGSFLKIRSRKDPASSTPAATGASPPKKEVQPPPMTPLEKMLQDSSAIREDGSDKFFGMENYGNTCYCNSILQCLYYSVPFREAVINYPTRTPIESLQAALAGNLRFQDAIANMEAEAQAEKQKAANAQRPGASPAQPPKPEDKDSPEYKKKMALQTMPILETKNNATSYGMSESLFTSLKDIFESVVGSQSRIGIIKPQHFLDILRRENEMFRSAMHQDAHEFLNLLLNEVVANVETEASKQPLPDRSLPPPTDSADSIDNSGSSGSKTPNTTRWVHELFEGTLTSETQCLTCEKVSQRDEIFLDLSVDLEQHSSVTSCLRKFSAEEMLCERNKFHCDNCGGLQEAEKRMKIKRLPRILALHLKRFKYTEDLQRLQKLFHRVVYPYHLRLFNTTDDAEDPDRLYELYAVVVHIGGGPYHGHYVAIIKTQDRGWLLFDDEMVEPVDKNFVRNFFGDKPGLACAYVLFYQETTLEAVLKEQEMENMQSAAGAAAADSTKQNGFPQSPGLAHVHSESAIHSQDEPIRPPGLSRAPSAPPLSTHPEHVELEKEKSPIKSPTRFSPSTPAPPVPPIPESHTFTLGTKKSDLQTKKERAKEEKERRIAEREREKQRRKEHEARSREQEAKAREDQRREEAQMKAAMEESRLSKAEEDRRNPDHGKSGGLSSRLKRGVSHRLGTHKENQRSSTAGAVISEFPSSPSNGIPEPSPPLQKSPASPSEPHRSKLQSKKNTSHEEDRDGLKNNKDLKHAPRSHGRWRSFSLRKKSFSALS